VFVSTEDAQGWAGLDQVTGSSLRPLVGGCTLVKYSPGDIEIDVKADSPGILRIADKYDADWKATLDGHRVVLRRVDYLFQGVVVPKGAHRVILQYDPPIRQLCVQGVGLVICFIAWASLIMGKLNAAKRG
jgi:hypothetical protein